MFQHSATLAYKHFVNHSPIKTPKRICNNTSLKNSRRNNFPWKWNDPNAQFYFAETEGRVIGYLKINTGSSQTEKLEGQCLEIERIYVLKEYHGKQVGQLLYNKAIQVAEELQADFVWLGVWEENHRAIHFYRKNGFLEFRQTYF